MELREKVIKGLECCATNRLRREDCEAMDCVYLDLEGHGCIHQLIRDALALLKAQEPRVMTLDEVRKLPEGTLVWQESRGVNQPRPRVVHCVTDEFIIYTDGCKWYFELDDYGTKFRLWTTEPSEMKRQAVKWE
jgi:hypothetical protein